MIDYDKLILVRIYATHSVALLQPILCKQSIAHGLFTIPCEGRPLFSVEAVEANSHCTHSASQGKPGCPPGRTTYLPTKTNVISSVVNSFKLATFVCSLSRKGTCQRMKEKLLSDTTSLTSSNPPGANIRFYEISPKLNEIERIWTRGGRVQKFTV